MMNSCKKEQASEQLTEDIVQNIEPFSEEKIIEAFLLADENAEINSDIGLRGLDPSNSPCYDVPDPSDVCTSNNITTTQYLAANPGDGRPACVFDVSFTLIICQRSDGSYYFQFFNIVATPSNSCIGFGLWFSGLTSAEKSDAIDKWEWDMSIVIELVYVNAIAAWLPVGCNHTSSFSNDQCYTRCLGPCNNCPLGFYVYKEYCGFQCCKSTREVCKTINGTILFGPQSYSTEGPACNASNPTCPFGSIPISLSCGVICGQK